MDSTRRMTLLDLQKEPVSYTHLDVYKRQEKKRLKRI